MDKVVDWLYNNTKNKIGYSLRLNNSSAYSSGMFNGYSVEDGKSIVRIGNKKYSFGVDKKGVLSVQILDCNRICIIDYEDHIVEFVTL